MNSKKFANWRRDVRIIWAITAKDILEALKNRYVIGVVITALFIGVAYSYIPALTALDNPTNLLVYDASSSGLGTRLKASQALEVYTYQSEEVVLEKLAHGEVPELGLVIPADFGEAQGTTELSGYALYWVSDEELASLTQEVEAEVTRLSGTPVQIQVAEERLVPNPDQHSLGRWVSAALVFQALYTGLGLISNLMLEEKQSRTLDALLVSPASSWHIVSAKALTGLFYCLLGMAVTLVINHKIILHWWLIIPALVIGALFSISLGLIAGALVKERGQLSLWSFGVLPLLFIPVFLSMMNELFPQWVNLVMALIPTVTMAQLVQASFSVLPNLSTLLAQFAWLVACTGAGLIMAVWVLRRQQDEQAGEHETSTRKRRSALRPVPRPLDMPPETRQAGTDMHPSKESIHGVVQGAVSVKPSSGMGIIKVIAVKDIRQSIHNKIIISILLGTTLLMLGNAMLLKGLIANSGSPANITTTSAQVLVIMICIVLLTLGVTVVPLLMVEEKEGHTLEALLVSPARYRQIVAGKALVGAIYCLSAAVVILVAYSYLFVHLELALLAFLLAIGFVVALGLLLGMLSNNPTTTSMWAAVIMLILIIPVVLNGYGILEQVPWLETIMAYWPPTAIIELINLSTSLEIPQGVVGGNAASVILASMVLYLLTWWMVKRSDR